MSVEPVNLGAVIGKSVLVQMDGYEVKVGERDRWRGKCVALGREGMILQPADEPEKERIFIPWTAVRWLGWKEE